jgi:ERCC4-related helicase
MAFAVGSLVKARGREWVVLPESEEDLLVLRPLGGSDDEVTGIYLPLEKVEPAVFDLPDPSEVGDHRSARFLRDAIRLGFRASAGPFRSFARLAVEPRPYQLVPLLMALKLDPVRLLIADDVGIGKTIEAGLIARELLDRGEIDRLAVLCPPPLAEQWQDELRDKFHIDAELVLSSTASRLERGTRLGQSLFDVYPFVIVSTDFIKSDRRRDEFLRTCPKMVIVDEAHTCAFAGTGRHQRYQLVSGLASDPDRHLILVTATPHSGKEDAFRSLLTFLDEDFSDLPEDLTGSDNVRHRRQLAAHFVQRRRGDIRHYLDANTPFPSREDAEATYSLSNQYKLLFDRVLAYARETVREPETNKFRKRVRWWSALALLRSMASSPAAAAATLRSRAASADVETAEQADEVGRRTVMDLMDLESAESSDITPGSDIGEISKDEDKHRRRLLQMARQADKLKGKEDHKLQQAAELIKDLLKDDFHPIIFCRFIPTAEYVAEELRGKLRGVEVGAVTGLLPPSEREQRVQQLAQADKRVLVCTDCLSEGINLQDHFDAVMHYDLSWNPTRHEQREGRVDRYGQPREVVRTLTYYGVDNQIDGVVLDVLIRKHQTIRSSLGISVPVPVNSDQVIEAIFEGLLLREKTAATALYLPGFEDLLKPQKEELYQQWEAASEREKRSRTMFAQETIKVDEVARELEAARAGVGSGIDVAAFTKQVLRAHGAVVSGEEDVRVDLRETPQGLRDLLGEQEGFSARFELPIQEDQIYLTRTHPIVEGLANYVMDTALDPLSEGVACRCGAIRTRQVERRTTLLLVRLRYHLVTQKGEEEIPLLAEEMQTLAFIGSSENAEWLSNEEAEALLSAHPDANIHPAQASQFVQRVVDDFAHLQPHLEQIAQERAGALLDAHLRVRQAAHIRGVRYHVKPQLPADVLGIFVYLPTKN